MWPFGRKSVRQRRLEVRKAVASGPSWFARWFRRPGAIVSLLVLACFALLVAGLATWPPDPMLYREGQYIAEPIRARVSFRILDEQRLAKAQDDKASSVPATFNLDAGTLDSILSRVENIPSILETAESLDKVDPAVLTRLDLLAPGKALADAKAKDAQAQALETQADALEQGDAEAATDDAEKLRSQVKALRAQAEALRAEAKPGLAVYQAWVQLAKPEQREALSKDLAALRRQLQRLYVVDPDHVAEQFARATSEIVITGTDERPPGSETPGVSDLIGQDRAAKIQEAVAEDVQGKFVDTVRPSVVSFIVGWLQEQPLYLYNAEQTANDIEAAVEALQASPPDTAYERYEQGDILVQPSRSLDNEVSRSGLGAAKLELLRREHAEYIAARNSENPWRPYLRQGSRAALAMLLVLGLAAYVVRYEPHVIAHPHRGALLAATLLLMLAMDKTTVLFPQINPYFALLPVCMIGAILAIAYDQRFALAVGAMTALLSTFQTYQTIEMFFVLVVGLVVFIYRLHEIRTRSRLLVASTITALLVVGVVWGLALKNSIPWPFALRNSLWAAGSVLLTGFVVQGLLPAIEKIYQCTTSSTLLEWCDASKALLRRLAMESPGTYNHSLQLGSMCEAAAERIGARGLLARVGAYYHDIGKINKPRYFTENQDQGTENKHDKLSPAMSVLVIVGHVKDGLEMAREYNLPTPLREFIATHHGTQLVRYFYHTASQQHEEGEGPAPEESQFRYPGPKPRSREAAILMLADAAESSVRAMTEPTPTRIRTQVHQRVTERLEDGQLDDCLLTLREVHEIEESLIKSLCGMYHGRIAYPSESDKDKPAPEPPAEDKPVEPDDEETPDALAEPDSDSDDANAGPEEEPTQKTAEEL